jgi:Pyruvate/2-oxoacid:ferredoxin oxidoreductase delta subunit
MADKGLCHSHVKDGIRVFRAAPFVPGIFEFVFYRGGDTDWDRELARDIYDYKNAWEARSPIRMPYPMQRVITIDEEVEPGNKVHTYDQVKTYIEQSDKIAVGRCYCRHSAYLRGEDTHGMPMETCIFLGPNADFGINCLGAREVTQAEALKVLKESEEAGLVHQTSNTADRVGYLCNCDRWHCFAIKIVLKQPQPAKVFNSGFEPRFDPDLCVACETCIDRCPAEALAMGDDDVPRVDLNLCFGCAVCASGCPQEAAKMVSKPGFEAPPKDQKNLAEAMMASFAKKA